MRNPGCQRADERANSRRGVHETDQAAETIDAEHLGEDGGVERDAAAVADPQHDREDDKQAVLRRDEPDEEARRHDRGADAIAAYQTESVSDSSDGQPAQDAGQADQADEGRTRYWWHACVLRERREEYEGHEQGERGQQGRHLKQAERWRPDDATERQ